MSKLHPCKIDIVQWQGDVDLTISTQICDDPLFINYILWIDEIFTNNVILNKQNYKYWSYKNSNKIVDMNY